MAPWLEHVPFADHDAILDPTCSDLTVGVLELLGQTWIRSASSACSSCRRDDPPHPGGQRSLVWSTGCRLHLAPRGFRGIAAISENMNQEWIRRGV